MNTTAQFNTETQPAVSMAQLLSQPKADTAKRPTRETCSDLLMIVLEKYNIDPNQFLNSLDD